MQCNFRHHTQILENFRIVHFVALYRGQFLRKFDEWSHLLSLTALNTRRSTISKKIGVDH
jgi:hypothetical protein